ncbi:hypothetical protein EXQ33_06540 [Clostridium botulinum]|nr:hypothetical protein [Clostridium botulinum]
MFKLTLKLFNNKKEKDNIDLFLQQLRENNIYFPGDGGGAMKHFIKEAIEKGFINSKCRNKKMFWFLTFA